MAQQLNLKIKGLFTSFNEFSEVPEGALLQADNIEILQDSIAQPRRGFDRESGGYSTSTHRTDALTQYQDKLIAHHGTTIGSATTLSYYDSNTWTSLGSYSAPTDYRMRFLFGNQNLYFTTDSGIYKIDAYNSTPTIAGAYKGLDIEASTSGSSGWLATGNNVAYRVVWGYKDNNNNLILGAPSQREVLDNSTGNSVDVSLTITIPNGVTTDWFIQVYRSSAVASGTEPSEELGLVYETNPSSSNITNKSITITDIVPDSLRGATIYTAASQQGLVNQNEQPPLAKDMAVFDEVTFYANTTSKHRFTLTLISVGGSNGIANDDTITIGGVTYTGKSSEDVANAYFDVVTGGSAASNITDTAKSLVRVINQHSSSTVYAYYLSGPDDLPGQILLEERSIGGSAFAITSSKSTCWNPSDIPSSGSTKTSTNDRFKNGIFWSKPNQPEAVPLPNFVQVGSKDSEILRVVPLREGLYIFKDGDGVYKLSGYYPNYQVDKIDDSVNLIAKESCQVLNNQIFCLSDQGVTVVTDSTKVISRPIEQDLLSLVNQNLSLVKSISFGIGYESDRKYYLFLPASSSSTYPTQAYVFNVFTNTWVRHTLNTSCGFVTNSNDFYLGDGGSNYLLKERKNYSYLDYVDYGFETTITSIDSTTIVVDSGFDNIDVGDILWQSNTIFANITAKDNAAQTLTIETDPGLSIDSVTILKAINTTIKWAPVTLANPGVQKQFHTASLLFKSDFTGTGYIKFSSDISQFDESVALTGRGLGLWGLFNWGQQPWGGASLKRPIRQWIPRAKQRCSQLTVSFSHRWGYANWQLAGITLFGSQGSEKIGRN